MLEWEEGVEYCLWESGSSIISWILFGLSRQVSIGISLSGGVRDKGNGYGNKLEVSSIRTRHTYR